MKLTIILLTVAIVQVAAKGLSQTVSFNGENASLREVLSAVNKQTGFSVIYNTGLLDKSTPVSLNVSNLPLKEFLERVFKDQSSLDYSIENTTIAIFNKAGKFNDNASSSFDAFPPAPIQGKVLDVDGHPLSGASITIKGSKSSTSTGADGSFSINANVGDVLIVSYVGFSEVAIKLTPSTAGDGTFLTITLKPSVTKLEDIEVVVNTGYQNIPKERATGSFTQINNQLLNRAVSPDILTRLKGITNGLTFNTTDVYGSTQINIRGLSTIFSQTDPLIVVDNFPYEGSINNINPNDIQSVTILKDAAAASIWGARASNGVIVITTKKGINGRQPIIEFNANTTVAAKPDAYYLPRMKTPDIISIEQMLFDQGFYDWMINDMYSYPAISPVVTILNQLRTTQIDQPMATALLDSLKQIDNRADISKYSYKESILQQYALNIQGGTDASHYFMSGGFDQTTGYLGEQLKRITVNLKDHIKLSDRLSVEGGLAYSHNKQRSAKRTSFVSTYPYQRLYDDNAVGLNNPYLFRDDFIQATAGRGFLDWTFNPVREIALNTQNSLAKDLRLFTTINYSILKGLDAQAYYQYQNITSLGEDYYDKNSFFVRNLVNQYTEVDPLTGDIISRPIPEGNILDRLIGESVTHNARLQLAYIYSTKMHALAALGGIEVRQVQATSQRSRLYGYDPATNTSKPVNYEDYFYLYPYMNSGQIPYFNEPGSSTTDRFRSYYLNASYTYNGKYILSGSARVDQSNLFGVSANQRSNPLWSAGAKWQVSKEDFYHVDWLPNLNLRTTFGYGGNINKSVSALTTIFYIGSNINNQQYANISNPPNPNLRWEKTGMLNLGIDFSSKTNIISGSIEYYQKKSVDLIGLAPLDGTTGVIDGGSYQGSFRGNVATVKGKGIDLQITSNQLRGVINWSTDLIINYNTDKVTKYFFKPTLSDIFSENSIAPFAGKPIYAVFSFPWAGLDPNTGDPLGYLDKVSSNDYGALTNIPVDQLQFEGSARPKYTGGLRNTIQFKQFSISANIVFKAGYYFRRQSINYSGLFYYLQSHTDYEKRWRMPGDELKTNVPSMIYPENYYRDYFYTNAAVLVEKGDHIRLQDIQLQYNWNISASKKNFSGQLYAYINNIGILWRANKQGIDPDFQRITPASRSFAIGIKTTF